MVKRKPESYPLKWHSKMLLPPVENSIFFDIETDLGGSEVWMIGLLYQGKATQFVAHTKKQEDKLLDDFAEYLENHPLQPLVCYSRTNFDFRVVWMVAKKKKHRRLQKTMRNRAWLDFCTIFGRSCRPPNGTLALKNVATYCGYPLKHGDYDGLRLSLEYYRIRDKYGVISPKFLKIAKEYNLDDIKIMPYLLDIFGANVNYTAKFLQGHTNDFEDSLDQMIENNEINYGIRSTKIGKEIEIKGVRISCKYEHFEDLYPKLLSNGIPVPTLYYGKNTVRMNWQSKLARERAAELFMNKFSFKYD